MRVVRLGQGDSIDDRVEPAIAAAIEPMPDDAGGRGFKGRDSGVGGQLSVGGETRTRAKDACESAGGERADAAEASQRRESLLSHLPDSTRQTFGLCQRESKPLRKPSHGSGAKGVGDASGVAGSIAMSSDGVEAWPSMRGTGFEEFGGGANGHLNWVQQRIPEPSYAGGAGQATAPFAPFAAAQLLGGSTTRTIDVTLYCMA